MKKPLMVYYHKYSNNDIFSINTINNETSYYDENGELIKIELIKQINSYKVLFNFVQDDKLKKPLTVEQFLIKYKYLVDYIIYIVKKENGDKIKLLYNLNTYKWYGKIKSQKPFELSSGNILFRYNKQAVRIQLNDSILQQMWLENKINIFKK